MAAIRRKSTFALWFYDVSHLRRQRTICISQSMVGCWKQTSAIFKFYCRFRFWPLHRHRYAILHRTTKFYTKYISDGLMTSYWFYKIAAIASQIYFRFLVWPCLNV